MAALHPPRIGRARRAVRLGLLGLAALAAVVTADRLFPPDLGRLSALATVVEARDGTALRIFPAPDGILRLPIVPDAIPTHFRALLLAFEDRRFDHHPGVDPLAVARAVWQRIAAGEVVSGASTISMQLARRLEPRPRTLGTKLIEMARAVQLEARFDKATLLAMYLTLTPYGGTIEGLRAASLVYFGHEPQDLTDAEAALLVALPQAPSLLRPDRAPEAARAARAKVLERARQHGALDPQRAAEAAQAPVLSTLHALPFRAPHLAERLHRDNPGVDRLRTTIDASLQARVEALARSALVGLEPEATVAALVVELGSRPQSREGPRAAVRAYVGSAAFHDARRAGEVDIVRAVRSPGSALKPLAYAMAFDAGILHPMTVLSDIARRFGDYAPSNFDNRMRGEVTATAALQQSLNIPAVAIFERLGPARFVDALARVGAPLDLAAGDAPGLPIIVGGAGITLERLVTLFAGLGAGGEVAPLALLRDAPTPPPERLVRAAAAEAVAEILRDAPPPPGHIPARHRDGAREFAFKTGTSYGYRDAWTVGFDREWAVGVWVGRPDGSYGPKRTGREHAAPLFQEIVDLLPRQTQLATGRTPAAASPPPALARFNASLPGRETSAGIEITFPVDGARIEAVRDGTMLALRIEARGGTLPITWLVNGAPLTTVPFRRSADWTPEGRGSARITAIDRDGRSATVAVWID